MWDHRQMTDDPQLEVLRVTFARLVDTHKTHEKERERLTLFGTLAKWVNIILSGLTLSGVLAILGTDEFTWKLVGALVAAVSTAFAVFQLSFDPLRSAEAHRVAAKRMLAMRNNIEILIADAKSNEIATAELRLRQNELLAAVASIYEAAPDTSPASYSRAQKALHEGGEMTYGKGQIDFYLPEGLRGNP
jgi:hypothetical protein